MRHVATLAIFFALSLPGLANAECGTRASAEETLKEYVRLVNSEQVAAALRCGSPAWRDDSSLRAYYDLFVSSLRARAKGEAPLLSQAVAKELVTKYVHRDSDQEAMKAQAEKVGFAEMQKHPDPKIFFKDSQKFLEEFSVALRKEKGFSDMNVSNPPVAIPLDSDLRKAFSDLSKSKVATIALESKDGKVEQSILLSDIQGKWYIGAPVRTDWTWFMKMITKLGEVKAKGGANPGQVASPAQ